MKIPKAILLTVWILFIAASIWFLVHQIKLGRSGIASLYLIAPGAIFLNWITKDSPPSEDGK